MFPVGARIGTYVVEALLGKGGTSEVYLVRRDGACFALKILKEEHRQNTALQARLMNEAEALQQLDVEGVVQVFDAGDEAGRPFYVMERLSDSLATRLLRPLHPSEAVSIIRHIARILSDLHARGVVHRDVKPENLLFASDGSLRLADFSHAKLPAEELPIIAHSTETGAFVGTREYAAPEQLLNAKCVDGSADVYSLGLILFEALAGYRPFATPNPELLARRKLTERAPRVSSPLCTLSPQLVQLTAQLLLLAHSDRPTAAEVHTRLDGIPLERASLPTTLRVSMLLCLPVFLSGPSVSEGSLHSAALPKPAETRQPPRTDAPTASIVTDADSLFRAFGDALDQQGLDEARELLVRTEALPSTPLIVAKRHQKQADLALEEGRLQEARTLYDAARKQFPILSARADGAASTIREADVLLHLGDMQTASSLYEAATREHTVAHLHNQGPRNFEVHLAFFHYGRCLLQARRFDEARTILRTARDAVPAAQPLWMARTEERLAAIPGGTDSLSLARSALSFAKDARAQQPKSRRTLMALLRAEHRYALLTGETKDIDAVFATLQAEWSADKRRALLAHDYLELLMESWASYPQRRDWQQQARAILQEISSRKQWSGDVHLLAWKKRLSP